MYAVGNVYTPTPPCFLTPCAITAIVIMFVLVLADEVCRPLHDCEQSFASPAFSWYYCREVKSNGA